MDAPSGTLLVYSTAPGKVASDGPKGQRNSPFTKSLLQAMQTPNVPVEQVLKDVRRPALHWAGFSLLSGGSFLNFVFSAHAQLESVRLLGNTLFMGALLLQARGLLPLEFFRPCVCTRPRRSQTQPQPWRCSRKRQRHFSISPFLLFI